MLGYVLLQLPPPLGACGGLPELGRGQPTSVSYRGAAGLPCRTDECASSAGAAVSTYLAAPPDAGGPVPRPPVPPHLCHLLFDTSADPSYGSELQRFEAQPLLELQRLSGAAAAQGAGTSAGGSSLCSLPSYIVLFDHVHERVGLWLRQHDY